MNRSSVFRWQTDPAFVDLIAEERAKLDLIENPLTLESLIPEAHAMLKEALEGGSSVSAARAAIALQVLKAASTVTRDAASAGSLESRLAALGDTQESD